MDKKSRRIHDIVRAEFTRLRTMKVITGNVREKDLNKAENKILAEVEREQNDEHKEEI